MSRYISKHRVVYLQVPAPLGSVPPAGTGALPWKITAQGCAQAIGREGDTPQNQAPTATTVLMAKK
jgi:hypothetical protein